MVQGDSGWLKYNQYNTIFIGCNSSFIHKIFTEDSKAHSQITLSAPSHCASTQQKQPDFNCREKATDESLLIYHFCYHQVVFAFSWCKRSLFFGQKYPLIKWVFSEPGQSKPVEKRKGDKTKTRQCELDTINVDQTRESLILVTEGLWLYCGKV